MALACLRKASQSRTAACQVSAAPAWRAVRRQCAQGRMLGTQRLSEGMMPERCCGVYRSRAGVVV